MIDLREYRRRGAMLADFLPWAALVALVAWVVPGFTIAGFWTAVGTSIIVSVVSWAEERRAQFEAHGAHFESAYFLTFAFIPPAEQSARVANWLYEGRSQGGADWAGALRDFCDVTDRILAQLEGFMPEAVWLSDRETLTYLHATISTNRHAVAPPDTPMHLDVLRPPPGPAFSTISTDWRSPTAGRPVPSAWTRPTRPASLAAFAGSGSPSANR